jgi:hypothetical protein
MLFEVGHRSSQHELEEFIKEIGPTKLKGFAEHHEIERLDLCLPRNSISLFSSLLFLFEEGV